MSLEAFVSSDLFIKMERWQINDKFSLRWCFLFKYLSVMFSVAVFYEKEPTATVPMGGGGGGGIAFLNGHKSSLLF